MKTLTGTTETERTRGIKAEELQRETARGGGEGERGRGRKRNVLTRFDLLPLRHDLEGSRFLQGVDQFE